MTIRVILSSNSPSVIDQAYLSRSRVLSREGYCLDIPKTGTPLFFSQQLCIVGIACLRLHSFKVQAATLFHVILSKPITENLFSLHFYVIENELV